MRGIWLKKINKLVIFRILTNYIYFSHINPINFTKIRKNINLNYLCVTWPTYNPRNQTINEASQTFILLLINTTKFNNLFYIIHIVVE